MSTDIGVRDETNSTVLASFLSRAITAQAFRSQFYSIMASDARLADEVRYAILQRVFFALGTWSSMPISRRGRHARRTRSTSRHFG